MIKMSKESNMTTIPLRKDTRNKLQELRIYKRETYDDILIRLINKIKE